MRILLTGATGSFGRHLARELSGNGCELVLLMRGKDGRDAARRIRCVVGRLPGTTIVLGDVALPGLGLSRAAARRLRTVDGVVHAAATTEFGLPLERSRRVNVEGTRNLVAFADKLPRLSRLGYVGTAFVAGRRTGRILETELAHDEGFVTTYEQSKYEAELLVRGSGLPVAIFRPSVVVDRRDEPRPRPSGLRFTLALIRAGLLPTVPCPSAACLDLVGAEDAARAVATLFLAERGLGTFHIAAGESAPRVDAIVAAAGAPRVRHVSREAFARELDALRRRNPHAERLYETLSAFVEILSYPKLFETSRAEALLDGPVHRSDPLAELEPAALRRSIRPAA